MVFVRRHSQRMTLSAGPQGAVLFLSDVVEYGFGLAVGVLMIVGMLLHRAGITVWFISPRGYRGRPVPVGAYLLWGLRLTGSQALCQQEGVDGLGREVPRRRKPCWEGGSASAGAQGVFPVLPEASDRGV
jgi:hypothetical protein